MRYGIENYHDKAKYKIEDRSYKKLRRYLIIILEECNI